MKNLLNKIYSALKQESTYEHAALFILTFACIMLVITTITNGSTLATPPAPTSHCEIMQITITTPAGYTVNEAIRVGKILEIVW